MAAVPVYIYLGDNSAAGCLTPDMVPQPGNVNGAPLLMGGNHYTLLRNWPMLMRTVPATNPGEPTYSPWWDGTANGGVGAFRKYHHIAAAQYPVPLVVDSQGDNWSLPGIGAFGATTTLMQKLGEKHRNAVGFRMLKMAFGAGAGFGQAAGFRPPSHPSGVGAAWTAWTTELTAMLAAMTAAGDTPVWAGIFVDCAVSDIVALNTNYASDALLALSSIRTHIGAGAANTPIFLVQHATDLYRTSRRSSALGADMSMSQVIRTLNTTLRGSVSKVYLADLNGAFGPGENLFAPEGLGSSAIDSTDPKGYPPEVHLQLGLALYQALLDVELGSTTPVANGGGIPVVVMLGDSQLVGNISPLHALLGDEESVIGPAPGSVAQRFWIWDDTAQAVHRYDVTTNANTLATTTNLLFGPEATVGPTINAQYADVVILKIAVAGACMASESVAAAAAAGVPFPIRTYDPAVVDLWPQLQEAYLRLKRYLMTMMGRVPDLRLVVCCLGDNDAYSTTAAAAFAAKIESFVAQLRTTLTTRTDGAQVGVVWLQPPKHLDSGGRSILGLAAARETVRAAVEARDAADSRFERVDGNAYELKRSDQVHYAGRAQYQVGIEIGTKGLALMASGGSASGSGADGGSDTDSSADPAEGDSSDSVAAPPTVQTSSDVLSVLHAAVLSGADVAAYTINGRTVQMRGLDEITRAIKFYEAAQARAQGLRRTRPRFLQ